MKFKALLFAGCLAVVAFAAQDPLNLTRTYKDGEKDTYKMAVTVSLPIGSADINLNMTQVVKKVFENGDADIETTVSDMRMSFGGNEIPAQAGAPAPQGRVQRYNKFGQPVGGSAPAAAGDRGAAMMDQMSFLRYAMFTGEKPMAVGVPVDIDAKDEKAGTRTWGKITLVKIENGVATISSELKSTNKQTGESKPMNLKFTSLVDTASSKLNKVDGTVTDLPANEQGMQVDSVKILMERVVR